MKGLFRSFLIHLVILWFTPSVFVGGFSIPPDPKTIGLAALILTCLHLFIAPFLKLILFPLSFATFGLASWLIHVFFLFVLMKVVAGVIIAPWYFPGFAYSGFSLPAISFSWAGMVIVVGLFMGITKAFVEFLVH